MPHSGRSAWWRIGPLLLALAFSLCVLPVAVWGAPATSEAADESAAHLPTVLRFAAQLPAPDLRDYPSATGPAYHLALAVASRLGAGTVQLRLISATAGLALVLLAWRGAARFCGPGVATALALAPLCSSYVLSGSAWLTTDIASVLLGSAAVGLAAWATPSAATFLAVAVLFASALCVRQTNLFLAAPVIVAGILASPLGRSASPAEQWASDEPRAWRRLAGSVAALLPGAALLGALVAAWGGMTPAHFRHLHDRGINPVAFPYGLALVGAWGSLLLLPMAAEAVSAVRRHALAVAMLAVLAGVAAALPASDWSREDGRWGGALWTLVRHLPTLDGRSPVIVVGAMAGAVVLSVLWVRAAEVGRGRHATVVTVALLALFAVQVGNSQVWERYFDPAILVSIAWLTAMGLGPTRPHSAGRAVAGALLLAAVQAAISVLSYALPAIRG